MIGKESTGIEEKYAIYRYEDLPEASISGRDK